MGVFYNLTFLLIAFISNAQQTLSRTVIYEKSNPGVGANVFIKYQK